MDSRRSSLTNPRIAADRNGHAQPPRILIASASVGSGHLRAAQAVELALRRVAPGAVIENVDVLTLGTAPFRWSYAGFYHEMIRHAPRLLGIIYSRVDQPGPAEFGPWHRLQIFLERLSVRPFLQLLASQPWDLVINTFFLPGEIIASLRKLGDFHAPQMMVTTDFEVHGNWVTQPCELYCTATEEAALYLRCYGIPAEATAVTGIPIHPTFCQPKSPKACRRRHGIGSDRPVVLFLASGPAVAPVDQPFRALLDVDVPIEILAVAGHRTEVRRKLAAITPPPRHRVRVIGYSDQTDELLAAADLVVTKPGGLTMSEALARGTGLVLVNPIPGQEERNSDYLLENGAAIKVNHVPTLAHKVSCLLRDPERLARLRASARRFGRPRAAFEVAQRALALLARRPAAFSSRQPASAR
jgi:processive 1,2-diacylglycerol beta-glucosyltransferase